LVAPFEPCSVQHSAAQHNMCCILVCAGAHLVQAGLNRCCFWAFQYSSSCQCCCVCMRAAEVCKPKHETLFLTLWYYQTLTRVVLRILLRAHRLHSQSLLQDALKTLLQKPCGVTPQLLLHPVLPSASHPSHFGLGSA
jgi:hypothetical protein